MITIETIETSTLGDRSYVVHDGSVAVVIDPQRDIDRVLELADRAGVQVVAVLETHIHNDYVTGGLALALETGASYHVSADDDVSFDRVPTRDGDVIEAGDIRLRAVATPGHTFTHLSYVLDGERPAVFSGGSLLVGSTGRPDLLGPEHTEELARLQHAAARRLADEAPDEAELLPTHGFGSFCSATQSDRTESTIGVEKQQNPALTQDEQAFVEETLAGLDDYPAYYVHMGPANTAGPDAPDLSPPARADVGELRRRLEAGEWLVDLRTRKAFAAGHAPGTFNVGIEGEFATYVGWLMPWRTPLTLLGESPEQVAEAQRELVRIGIERPAASAAGGPRDWSDAEPASFPRATFGDLAQVRHHRPVSVLDVRRASEYCASHVDGARNIPIHEVLARLDELPRDEELWIHCASGYRASIAASIIAASGRQVVAIDDDFDKAVEAGVPVAGADGGRDS